MVASIETNSGSITEKLPPRFVLQAIYPGNGTETVIEIITELSKPEEQMEDDLDNADMDDELLAEAEEEEIVAPDEPSAENGAAHREGEEDSSPADDLSPQSGEEIEEAESIPQMDQFEQWEVAVRGPIYVPTAASATELALTREVLPEKELVSAFFIDPTMARRIEERDGSIYFTDGKKGLRLYAVGNVEYTAPGLDVFNNRLSYSAALLEAAKSQSLYGGWPHGVFLERREKSAGGYRFFWRSYAAGFPLVTDESSCEMVVNDKGMPYYRRSFYTITEKTGESHPYAHYKDVIYRSISLHPESFPLKEATLLALEPVYRVVQLQTGVRAVPAWFVHFAETGRFYLHWQTLELL